jgi:hypothetical protein
VRRTKLDYEPHQPAQDEWTFRSALPLLVLLFVLCAIPLVIVCVVVYVFSGGAD